jgi:glycosyltransferase involved in cell wall biosynthesis
LPEIIHDGRDGLLVEPGDPSAMSERILDVLQSSDLAARLTEEARSNLPAFTWQAIGKRLAEIYRTVL